MSALSCPICRGVKNHKMDCQNTAYVHALQAEKAELIATEAIAIETLNMEVIVLRRAMDNLKVRSYELGQRELHDMALAALQESNDE